jgi:hypothetical protein
MKILMVAICVLMLCFSSSHVWAQNCKPDVSQVDKISKQPQDYWFQTIVTSDVAITVWLRSSANGNSVAVQIDKQEAAATSNTQFQSALHAEKGNQFYFGLKNGEPAAFVATTVQNETKVSGSFMAGFTGKNLYTKVVLAANVQAKDLETIRDALTRKQIDAIRIVLAGDVRIDKSVNDKDGKKMMDKFLCFYHSLEKNGIGTSAAGLQPVPPMDAAIPGKYIRKDKPSDYIELNPDGTFSLQQDGKGHGGNYNVQADTITVQVLNAPASSLRVSGNTLVEPDGTIWEKQGETQKVPAAAQLTNEQIIQMVAAKLPDDVIIAAIRKSASKFDLTPDALIKLKTAGVSDAVLRAMVQ